MPEAPQRLQKVLARAGVRSSRRKAEALISDGRVMVNGQIAELGSKVGPEDEVRVDGALVRPLQAHVTLMFHKPAGVITAVSDDRGRKTVMDYLPDLPGLHPVGRLDYDSEGLLLLTNDGELTQQLTHPRYGHEKEYRVWCEEGRVKQQVVKQLERGVMLEDGEARALRAWSTPEGCALVLGEGRNRQVRRMLEALGYSVTRLVRLRVGGLELAGLEPGAYRELSARDLAQLGYTARRE